MDESCSIQTLPFSCIKMRNRYQNLLRNKSLIFGGHLTCLQGAESSFLSIGRTPVSEMKSEAMKSNWGLIGRRENITCA